MPEWPRSPIRLPKINKTHADIPQKDNIQEDNLKEDYPKEDYLHEPQAMGRVNLSRLEKNVSRGRKYREG